MVLARKWPRPIFKVKERAERDMTLENDYTTPTAKERNEGTHTPDTNTHQDFPFPPEAQQIIDASGLEPAYKDIVPD